MSNHDYPRKIQYILADLEARRFGDRREWDKIEVERSDAYGSPFFTIRASRYAGTLAEETLMIFHTATRFISAYKDPIVGKSREYKTRKQLAIHELYRNW